MVRRELRKLEPAAARACRKTLCRSDGGAGAVMSRAREAVNAGDHRWAATLLHHVAFAEPDNQAARELLAATYTRLGFESEAGIWRNIYLTGAQELGDGVVKLTTSVTSSDALFETPTTMLFDVAAVRLNPDKAAAQPLKLNVAVTDRDERHLVSVRNGVLIHEQGVSDPQAAASIRLKHGELVMTLLGGAPVAARIASGDIAADGDWHLYEALVAMIESPEANFAIVTP
ncbi:MAG TPA: alkyl sulfatase C-terminal domain-containing protein [Candidatus Binataceae bacterium]|nr:alkyl sulfatase C-terminal domain-containing protein [Candidatus Binataceae bacterium]